LDTRHKQIDTGNIWYKTQKERHREHWAQDTERYTRVTLGTRQRKIDKGNIVRKTKKDRRG
jgi:hypothetical protein